MKPIIVLTCLSVAALSLPVQAQQQSGSRMYKCVDPAGKVYYSDKLNPDCGHGTELNRQGVVMKKKELPRPAQPGGKTDVVAVAKNTEEQDRRDRALMATYTSVEEIDAARDRSLALPAQGTKSVESKLEKANVQLVELKKQADTLATQKKALPPRLLEDVSANQKEIAALEADIVQRKVQSDAIRARYDADKRRFSELKGLAPQ